MKNDKKLNYLAKHILRGSFNVSAWIFLSIIELGEITVSAFLFPSIYKELPNLEYIKYGKSIKIAKNQGKTTIKQSLRRLQKQGFIEKKNNKLRLTKLGKILAKYILERKESISAKWDGKYRIVVFDIPERIRIHRDWLRQELYILGYKKLQESVFWGKNPLPRGLISEIKKKEIGDYVNYILADKIFEKFE